MQFILSSFIWELKDVVFIVSLNHTFQLKIPLVIIFLNLHMWQKNLEQNMFCTFLLTGHLSFYDPSPHSINESILFTWTLRGRNQTSTCEYTAWNEMGTWIKIRVRTCEKHCEMGVCLAAACMLPYDPPPPTHTHTHTHNKKYNVPDSDPNFNSSSDFISGCVFVQFPLQKKETLDQEWGKLVKK